MSALYTTAAQIGVADGKINMEMVSEFEGVCDRLWQSVIDTHEAAVRAALIKLGWTPPAALTWQDQLREEATQLEYRIEKLRAFMLNPDWITLSEPERVLLKQQLYVMVTYRGVLERRKRLAGVDG